MSSRLVSKCIAIAPPATSSRSLRHIYWNHTVVGGACVVARHFHVATAAVEDLLGRRLNRPRLGYAKRLAADVGRFHIQASHPDPQPVLAELTNHHFSMADSSFSIEEPSFSIEESSFLYKNQLGVRSVGSLVHAALPLKSEGLQR